jgi:hypothetical protein
MTPQHQQQHQQHQQHHTAAAAAAAASAAAATITTAAATTHVSRSGTFKPGYLPPSSHLRICRHVAIMGSRSNTAASAGCITPPWNSSVFRDPGLNSL